jgi:large subunit ribosomal protein L7/L12
MASKSYETLINQIGEMSVIELAEMIKALEEKFGVSATPVATAAPVAAAGAAPVAAAAEKSEYKVTLEAAGDDKMKVIKALRSVLPNMTIGDTKKAVEEVPTVIAEAAPKDEAKKMKEALEAAGAKVKLA